MAVIKCKQCGTSVELDEKVTQKMACPVCGQILTLEQDAPDTYKKIQHSVDELKKELESLVANYKKTGSDEDIRTKIVNGYAEYVALPDFYKLWRGFISGAAGAAAEKKDNDLLDYLKAKAKEFDKDNINSNYESLYIALLQAYKGIGTCDDWEKLIEETQGDNDKFTSICNSIIRNIVNFEDKAFAIDLFRRFEAKGEKWANTGRIYLRTLLNSDEVAANVFTVSSFNPRTKKFIRSVQAYNNKYIEKGNKITLDETKVWKNYTEACKRQKRRNVIIISSILAVILAASLAVFFYFNSTKKDSVEFDIDKVIEVTYGESLDLSDYTVTYTKNSGEKVTEQITLKMLSGYDPEKIGTQTVYVEYQGSRTGITIRVNPATLQTPIVTQSDNYITWEFVPYAANYNVYVNSSSAPTATVSTLSYDLSSIPNYGELTLMVRANSNSEKYNNSVMSEALTVIKLQPPTNLKYEDGVLSWDIVESASYYEIIINGNAPQQIYTNSFETDLASGNNDITIIAKSSEPSVIEGITNQTIYYYKLLPITSMSYENDKVSWEAESSATIFSVYVDGQFWQDLYRKYFSIEADGFASEFGEGQHTVGIVCKSSAIGTEPSEMVSYDVSVGNHAKIEDNTLQWNPVGVGATYIVWINGEEAFRLNSPIFSLADWEWKEGANTVAITVILNDKTVILEAASVTKLSKPSIYISGGNWVTDGNANNRYSVNGGEWQSSLQNLSSLEAGDYTVTAKRIASSGAAFEIESDIVEVKIRKIATPTISVNSGEIICNYDQIKYSLNLYYSNAQDGTYSSISNLSEIRTAGEYFIKATLSAFGGTENGFDYVIDSDYSLPVSVVKLEAPSVYYNEGEGRVTSDSANVKFYYIYNGEEVELRDGLISNLPQGIFEIYARRIAQAANELTSENSPADKRAEVFNMNITLSISVYTQSQFTVIFGGCEEIDSLTFSYEVNLYDRNNTYIGQTLSQSETTVQKGTISNSNIVTTINYRANATFEPGYGHTDVYRVELVVYISSGSNVQQLSASMNV